MKWYQDNLFNELIVDNFAGGGGASVGIELAVGRPVDIAINHDADAIEMHKVNHRIPNTTKKTYLQSIPSKSLAGDLSALHGSAPTASISAKQKAASPRKRKFADCRG